MPTNNQAPHHNPARLSIKTLTRLLGTAGSAALVLGWSSLAFAQVTIEDDRTAPVDTATEGDDVTISSTGSVILTDNTGPAVTVNSNNTLTNSGTISISDVDGATAVSLEGGADRGFTNSGSIAVDEDYTITDEDDDGILDGPRAIGSGRTGILISGAAAPFEGDVTLAAGSSVRVEGNESYGVNFAGDLTGDFSNAGTISLLGANGASVNIAGNVTGDVVNTGSVATLGENSYGYNITGDIQGGFANAGTVRSNGFRFDQRIGLGGDNTGREDLVAEDLMQSESAIAIRGNVSEGLHFQVLQSEILDDDGVGTGVFSTTNQSSITQIGSAPAILIDGEGTPIAIGRVSQITDVDDDDYDENLLYGFVNEGFINSQGVFDDFDATILSVSDATIEGGILNTGTISVSAFRGPGTRVIEGITPGTGFARAIVLGNGAIVDAINNQGVISVQASEAIDEVYADSDNPLDSVAIAATAIDISANATTGSLYNSGTISALIIGRNGEAYAIRDSSGSLNSVTNEGAILSTGRNSDALGVEETIFTLVAIDASENTSGFTYTQQRREDEDTTDSIIPSDPITIGDIRLGTGDDIIIASAGSIVGDIDFGTGQDQLLLSGESTYAGEITNTDNLTIQVSEGSSLALSGTEPVALADASFDGTSTFLPTIDGQNNNVTTLQASGTVAFEDGAIISPRFSSIVSDPNGVSFTLASANTLDLAASTLELLNATDGSAALPFLYNFNYEEALIGGQEALVVTVDLRNAEQLGLDTAQSGALEPAIGAFVANSALGAAVSNITNQEDFNDAFNQLMPEFAAAAREFVVANVDGATGAVGNHLDAARRSPDKPGGAWIQEFAYFADRDLAGLSEQYRGAGFGMSGGLDVAWGPFHAVGVNVGFASTEIEDVVGQDEPLDVVTLQGGLYAGLMNTFGGGVLGSEFYVGGGYNSFEQERRVRIDDFLGRASADYSGTHINASARTGYEVELSDKFWVRPAVSLDYLRLNQGSYTETGDEGIALDVSSRSSERASASAMLNFGAKFQGKRTWIRPSMRVGYRHAFLDDPTQTEFGFAGLSGQRATIDSFAFPSSGILLGFTVAAGSAYSSIGFDVDSEIRDGFIRHTGRVVIRLLF